MNKFCTILLIRLLKYFPIILNIQLLLNVQLYSIGIDISNWIYCLTGTSMYVMVICFISSFVFKFCIWYRVLCISSIISLILEYIDINIVKINYYLYAIQGVVILGLFVSLILFVYGKRSDKENNKSSKKAY